MNKINDRDLTELSSYRVYQDINKDNDFTVNEKRFKQADVFEDLYREKLKDTIKLFEVSYEKIHWISFSYDINFRGMFHDGK